MSTDDQPNNVLFRWYEHYIGTPTTESDVYLGFGLFIGGIVTTFVALVLFLIGAARYGLRTDPYFALAQPAYALGMIAVPMALLAVVVLLPTERRAKWTAIVGAAITGGSAVLFLRYYPDSWFEFGTQQTLLVVGSYAIGLAIVTAATGGALVAHQIARVRPPEPSEIQPTQDPHEEEDEVTEEQVRADIEQAMAEVELNWGGVAKEEHRRLNLTEDYADEAASELDVEPTKTVSSESVDKQVEGLAQLRGIDRNVSTSDSTVDNETAALNSLKEEKRQDEIPEDAPASTDGTVGRILTRLGIR